MPIVTDPGSSARQLMGRIKRYSGFPIGGIEVMTFHAVFPEEKRLIIEFRDHATLPETYGQRKGYASNAATKLVACVIPPH